jgi:intein-encoded DNA endonuclease-like protein
MDLSKKYNLHRGKIQRILKRNNIHLRRTSPWKNRYKTDFFKSFNKESCYWAGFIAADGCIRSNRATTHIKLQIKDKIHLESFKSNILFEGNIMDKISYCTIDINGKWFIEDLLNNFEISSRKTFNVKISDKIPEELLHHFIRGYFDGDGCVTWTTTITINFTSGSQTLLNQIQEIFYDLGIRLKSRNRIPPICKGIQFSYSGKNAISILEWMYQDSEDLRLERKYETYQKLILQN